MKTVNVQTPFSSSFLLVLPTFILFVVSTLKYILPPENPPLTALSACRTLPTSLQALVPTVDLVKSGQNSCHLPC